MDYVPLQLFELLFLLSLAAVGFGAFTRNDEGYLGVISNFIGAILMHISWFTLGYGLVQEYYGSGWVVVHIPYVGEVLFMLTLFFYVYAVANLLDTVVTEMSKLRTAKAEREDSE